MTEPILEPGYWSERMVMARGRGKLFHAVYEADPDYWAAIEKKHREIIAKYITPGSSILDVGCGWGRLLTLMPPDWYGNYLGIDLCPDFLAEAVKNYPNRLFVLGDAAKVLPKLNGSRCHWAILVSVRAMIQRNLGMEYWCQFHRAVAGACYNILYLEYDPNDEGSRS